MTRHVPAAALALALAAALPFAPAMAASDDARRTEQQALATAKVDAAAAVAAVTQAGHGVVREVEWERDAWKVKTVNAEAKRVALRVDAVTGAVTRRDR